MKAGKSQTKHSAAHHLITSYKSVFIPKLVLDLLKNMSFENENYS